MSLNLHLLLPFGVLTTRNTKPKTETQNRKQNHKTQNRNPKPKTETQNPKQKHKIQNENPKLKTETQNPKQKPKTVVEGMA